MKNLTAAIVILLLAAYAIAPGCATADEKREPARPAPRAKAGSGGLVEGFDTTPAAKLPRPALNVPFVDPAYGTTITRVSSSSQITDRDVPTWVRHEYSRKQAFNADSSRALMISSNGWVRLYQVNANNTMNFVKTLNLGEPQEPQWHPTDANLIYVFGYYGNGMTISTYDIRSDQIVATRNLGARLKTIFGATASLAWTKQEGRPSDDGRIWCLQVQNASYGMLGLVAYDFVADQILGNLATTELPDHVSTSPKGNYCVPSWGNPTGTRAYTVNFASYKQLHTTSEHSDLARTIDDREVYVFTDYGSGDVAMVDLASGARTNLFPLYGPSNSGTAMHISGTARNVPGYVLVSFYACFENYGSAACTDARWFKNKLVAVELKASPRVLNIAHSHYGDAGYFGETQATVNADFTRILFASSWESALESDLSDYLVTLPAGALSPRGGGATCPV
jgi:hypothetical protein